MIMFIPTIPGPYHVGTNLTLRCTVTLDPDDRDYEYVNTWMSGPSYSDDDPIYILYLSEDLKDSILE